MPLNLTRIPAGQKRAPAPWWLLRYLACSLLVCASSFSSAKWTEYNLGPFFVDTDTDASAARFDLTQLEQARWVMASLLEIRDLNAAWPFRVLVTKSFSPTGHFARHNGYYLLVTTPGTPMPLDDVARLFLEANTPRLPEAVESGVGQLFSTIKANGSRVSWGSAPAHPDLAFARMQLFATKFEYGASFHIFLGSLRNGSSLHAAEHNAYGKDAETLEQEASSRLKANDFQPVSVSGRPLDPKRDFGEHALDETSANVYAASAQIPGSANIAEGMLTRALNDGGAAKPMALEALGEIAASRGEKPIQFWNDAIDAGCKDAAVYVEAADNLPPDQSLPLLRKASLLNPRWAQPIYLQALATEDLSEREALLKQAIRLNSRSSDYWITLARTQLADGHDLAASSTWARAEDAAPDEATRKSIQQLRASAENVRLDEAEAKRKREHDQVVLADQRAQQAEAARIHAAEERANKASGGDKEKSSNSEILDWNSLTKPQKTSGQIVRVDCRDGYTKVAFRDLRGKTRQLLYDGPDHKTFSCDSKTESHPIVVTFRPREDNVHGTDGDIVSVAWR